MVAVVREHREITKTVHEVVSALINAVYDHEKSPNLVVSKGWVETVVIWMTDEQTRDAMVVERQYGVWCAIFLRLATVGHFVPLGKGP